ncbi:hypothetical protein, partial [Methylocella sp.]|uniref:hypothetical protein n=1 Tax=Methylocella sp. TaxID=1978226 RepID=UPI003784CC21
MKLRVVHEVPGRLRLRLAGGDALLPQAAAAVRDVAGVSGVRVNAGCGALVVVYDGDAAARRRILAAAADPPRD